MDDLLFSLLETKTMRDQLQVIEDNSNNLTSLAGDLDKGLNDARTNLSDIQTQCVRLGASFCNDTVNTADLKSDANFTNLPNVSSELSKVEDVVDQDFEKTAEEVSLLNPPDFM